MHWFESLSDDIVPTHGLVRPMRTLIDANLAITHDLPRGFLKIEHWAAAAKLLLIAANTGAPRDIQFATDALFRALRCEGWI